MASIAAKQIKQLGGELESGGEAAVVAGQLMADYASVNRETIVAFLAQFPEEEREEFVAQLEGITGQAILQEASDWTKPG